MKYENAYLRNEIKFYCLCVHFLKSMNEKIAYLVKNYIFISEWPSWPDQSVYSFFGFVFFVFFLQFPLSLKKANSCNEWQLKRASHSFIHSFILHESVCNAFMTTTYSILTREADVRLKKTFYIFLS